MAEPYNTGDKFTDELFEQTRRRRQMGGMSSGSYGVDLDYLNSPPLRQRMYDENSRESTNVEDRREENYIVDPDGPFAMPGFRLVGGPTPQAAKKMYDVAIQMGQGFMEDVNRTLQELVNPSAGVTAEPGTEERYAQEILARRTQGRAAARVGMDLAAGGMSRAVGASEAAVGAFGGRLPNKAQIREGMEARVVYDDAAKAEFRIGTPEGKKIGEYTVMEGSVPNTLSIENIVVNKEFQRQGVARDVYAQLRAQAGDKEVIPSGSLQEGTYKLWKEMNPKLLEAGKYKKLKDGSYERTDDNFTSYFTQAAGATVASAGAASVGTTAAKAGEQGDVPEPTLPEKALLNVLLMAEKVESTTPLRLYNDFVQRGRTEPVSEKDFTPDQLEDIRTLVMNHGKKKGTIGYDDYKKLKDPRSGVRASLGGFNYKVDDEGNITVHDTYDFNVAKRPSRGENDGFLYQALAAVLSPVELASKIGRDRLPDTGGKGVKVEIKIPKR